MSLHGHPINTRYLHPSQTVLALLVKALPPPLSLRGRPVEELLKKAGAQAAEPCNLDTVSRQTLDFLSLAVPISKRARNRDSFRLYMLFKGV